MKFILYFIIILSTYNINSKLLVLIISSDYCPIDNCSIYKELQKIWKLYMHYDTKNVESYFVTGNTNLEETYKIIDDTIWSKTNEGWPGESSGIIHKTILSLECLQNRLNEFDFILRTNLSSFYIFPRLLKFLEKLPKNRCYCGSGVGFASGCGFIISPDVARLLIENKKQLIYQKDSPDDVLIGKFLIQKKKFKLINHTRFDVLTLKSFNLNNINDDIFQFRVKNDKHESRLTEDLEVYKILLEKFYNIVI